MKKILLTMAVAATMMAANAQDMMSKRGTPILPEAGDWSVGFDATPLLNYAGNFINHDVNNTNMMAAQQHMTLVGLYVVDANTAYRGKVGINFGSTDVTQGSVNDSMLTPSEVKTSTNSITLGFGMQKSRGKGRLHGIYGAELDLTFGGATDITNSYAKSLSPDSAGYSRVDENKTGSTFGLAINGFLGVEYFFAPKMSLSAEYLWGIGFSSTSAGTITTESANGTAVTTTSASGAKNSSFNIGNTDAASIVLHFYF